MVANIKFQQISDTHTRLERTSPLSGKRNDMDLFCSVADLKGFYDGTTQGLIQDVFPRLTPAEREFVLTGHTQADWDKMFPAEDEVEA